MNDLNSSLYPSAEANFSGWSYLFKASHVGAGISVGGILLNVTLLSVIIVHWSALIKKTSNIGVAVLVMVVVSILHGSLMLTMDEMWVDNITVEFWQNTTGTLDIPDVGNTLSSASYLLLTILFAANLLLSLERHWVIRFGISLSRLAVSLIFGSALLFSSFFFAAFAISSDGVSWTFLPLAKPCTWDYDLNLCKMSTTQTVLFVIGMSYFLLVSLAICTIYENSYFLIATVFETEDQDYDSVSGKRRVHQNVKVQRSVRTVIS
ncbi:UNVERIFIED_CONTAM: hypothetical protein HDU68_001509 [Siphonaria sp. JEL0065]|nr:hypothetical protein HDU68_001509 [Siphonaria sp. JEL0065]